MKKKRGKDKSWLGQESPNVGLQSYAETAKKASRFDKYRTQGRQESPNLDANHTQGRDIIANTEKSRGLRITVMTHDRGFK